MQRLTFELIGAKAPLTQLNSEDIRTRTSELGFIDPSIILKTDNTVSVSINKNIYTISTALSADVETGLVSTSSTITLLKDNHGIQDVLVNIEKKGEPAYVEYFNYTIVNGVITLNTADYDDKEYIIKYLTTK